MDSFKHYNQRDGMRGYIYVYKKGEVDKEIERLSKDLKSVQEACVKNGKIIAEIRLSSSE